MDDGNDLLKVGHLAYTEFGAEGGFGASRLAGDGRAYMIDTVTKAAPGRRTPEAAEGWLIIAVEVRGRDERQRLPAPGGLTPLTSRISRRGGCEPSFH